MDSVRSEELQYWMTRLAEGDRSVFHPLFAALWPMVHRFTLRALGNEADAEDAAQQALLNVFARATEFDPDRPALPWILAIATNECRTLRKRVSRRRESPLDEPGNMIQEGPELEQLVLTRDLERAARELLHELGPQDVETILAAIGGQPDKRPDVPAATFRKRLQRAYERLRSSWRARHGAS